MERAIHNRVVSRENWLAARRLLLAKEKELTRRRDQLCIERRELPWMRVDKEYIFDGPDGKVKLAELFGNRSQLVINHIIPGPDRQAGSNREAGPDLEEGRAGCSSGIDPIRAALVYPEHQDVSYVAVSRASLSAIEVFKKRMDLRVKWVSSLGSDFTEDMPGMNLFYRDESEDVYHTYSAYGSGAEELARMYLYADLRPQCPEDPAMFCLRLSDRFIAGI